MPWPSKSLTCFIAIDLRVLGKHNSLLSGLVTEFSVTTGTLSKSVILPSLLFLSRLKGFTRDHARQSESNVENISSANSPTMLERKYEQFYDHERMDAVEHIDLQRYNRDKLSETCDKYVACRIFEVTHTYRLLNRRVRKYLMNCIFM